MRECAELPEDDGRSCTGYGVGAGIVAVSGAVVSGRLVWLDRQAHHVGLQLCRGATSHIAELIVSNNAIGVNLRDLPQGYDFHEAHTGLWIVGNTIDFDQRDLQVPDPSSVLPPLAPPPPLE